jgi:hypothetical protein
MIRMYEPHLEIWQKKQMMHFCIEDTFKHHAVSDRVVTQHILRQWAILTECELDLKCERKVVQYIILLIHKFPHLCLHAAHNHFQ